MRRRVLLGSVLMTTACSAPAPSATAPAPARARVLTNLAYADAVEGSETAHLLDLHLPGGVPGPWPVLLFQAGSGFGSDDTKGSATDLSGGTTAASLAQRWGRFGLAVAGLNVRSSAQARFPAQRDDVHAALRFLRGRADELGLDPARCATSGTSSGGWGAVMAAVTGTADDGTDVQCVVDLFGPTDFLQMDAQRLPDGMEHDPADSPESRLMGFPIQSDPEATAQANPVTHVTRDSPPVWVSHGTSDPLVPWQQSQLLFDAYAAAGAEATLTLVEGAGHTDAYLGEGAAERTVQTTRDGQTSEGTDPDPTYDAVLTFLQAHLGLR